MLHGDCWFSSPFVSEGGSICPPLEVRRHVTPLKVDRGQPGKDSSVAASGTDWAWRIGMTLVEAVSGASSGGDVRFASMDLLVTIAHHVWIVGGV